jgi:methionine synthase II (cobalamin-independent)
MIIQTEPIGSIPRPPGLIEQATRLGGDDPALEPLYAAAIQDTVREFEATGSPVITDGEQRKYHNFWTYSVEGLHNTAPEGFRIPFAAGHVRRKPRLTSGPFRYKRYADSFLDVALRYAHMPVKQAVISPSALSLMYPAEGIPGYTREEFIDDLLREHETVRDHMKPDQRIFVGVIAPIDPSVETPEEVRDRILEAARYIPVEQLGTTDECGFSPFCDDTSTTRDKAFAKIRSRVLGTALAEKALGGG